VCTPAARFGLFTARAIEAGEALAIGLATEVVEDAEARVAELCELLAGHAAVTMRSTKEALRRLRTVRDGGDDLVLEAYESAEFRARVAAFLRR
jgi:enoyl-CoA hydratase